MLGLHAISDAAISALPDYLTGRVSATASIRGLMECSTVLAASEFLVDPDRIVAVFAVEIYTQPLSG